MSEEIKNIGQKAEQTPKKSTAELSDEDLEQVAGGAQKAAPLKPEKDQ